MKTISQLSKEVKDLEKYLDDLANRHDFEENDRAFMLYLIYDMRTILVNLEKVIRGENERNL